METLVIRLCVDLRKETFDDQTKTTIELTRNITDINSFCFKVKEVGAVQTGLQLGNTFLESARKLTDSIAMVQTVKLKKTSLNF